MKMFNVQCCSSSQIIKHGPARKSIAHKLITITASSPNLIPLFAFSFSFFHSWKNCSAAFTILFFPWIWLSPLLFHIFMFKLLPPLSKCAWLVLSLSFPDLSELIISTLANLKRRADVSCPLTRAEMTSLAWLTPIEKEGLLEWEKQSL
mgnify:CR=1 FL=1